MFSIVIPLYNKEKSVVSTIHSVLQQTFQDFEIVIVNDGSTDNSLYVVKQIKDNRIRIIDKINEGVSATRNLGIENSIYEWIAFLDADDLWEKDHLETVYNLIQQFSDVKVFSTSYVHHNKDLSESRRGFIEIDNYFRAALTNEFLWTSVVVINKVCFDRVGLFNTKLSRGEDIDLWMRISKKFKIVKSKNITAIYRLEAENRACNTSLDYDKSIVSVLDFNDIKSAEERRYKRKIIRERLIHFVFKKNYLAAYKMIKRYGFNIIK